MTEKIIRWKHYGEMVEDKTGWFVLETDHEQLMKERDLLQLSVNALQEEVLKHKRISRKRRIEVKTLKKRIADCKENVKEKVERLVDVETINKSLILKQAMLDKQ